MSTTLATPPKVICIWTVPRSCGTALAKCLSFVDDVQFWLEPYTASYFNETLYNPDYRKGDPLADKMRVILDKKEGSEEMKALRKEVEEKMQDFPNLVDQHEVSYEWTKKQLELQDPGKKFIITKNQSFAIIDYLEYIPDVPDCHHVLLTRHPREECVSWKELIQKRLGFEDTIWENFHVADDATLIPFKELYQIHNRLWNHLLKTAKFEPIVIDSYDVLSNPGEILPKLFSKLGIEYREAYLEWDASEKIIEKKWKGSADFVLIDTKTIVYDRAVKSSRFEAPKQPYGTPSKPELKITAELEEFINDAMPFYDLMYAKRLK